MDILLYERVEKLEKELEALKKKMDVLESSSMDRQILKMEEEVKEAFPEVDRSKICLTDGSPVPADESHKELRPDGQQKGYVVLTEEERGKGFVRPVRQTYVHMGIRPKNPTRPLTDREKQVYSGLGYVEFEAYPDSSKGLGRYWTKEQLNSGCGTSTKMGLALAETYARDPKFYGATMCVQCGKHFPVEQFVWEGTDQVVGS